MTLAAAAWAGTRVIAWMGKAGGFAVQCVRETLARVDGRGRSQRWRAGWALGVLGAGRDSECTPQAIPGHVMVCSTAPRRGGPDHREGRRAAGLRAGGGGRRGHLCGGEGEGQQPGPVVGPENLVEWGKRLPSVSPPGASMG